MDFLKTQQPEPVFPWHLHNAEAVSLAFQYADEAVDLFEEWDVKLPSCWYLHPHQFFTVITYVQGWNTVKDPSMAFSYQTYQFRNLMEELNEIKAHEHKHDREFKLFNLAVIPNLKGEIPTLAEVERNVLAYFAKSVNSASTGNDGGNESNSGKDDVAPKTGGQDE